MTVKKTVIQKFLLIATSIAASISAVAGSYVFLQQMLPNSSSYDDAIINVDVANLAPGQAISVKWRGNNVIIKNRTQAEIDYANSIPFRKLKDKSARNANLAPNSEASDIARSAGAKLENWFVYINKCTHLGCPLLDQMEQQNRIFCPCHGSIYDTAGRVLSGPATQNLAIPPYKFIAPHTIRIG